MEIRFYRNKKGLHSLCTPCPNLLNCRIMVGSATCSNCEYYIRSSGEWNTDFVECSFNINKEMYKIAVNACSEVYDENIKLNLGTEYSHFLTKIGGKTFQVIAVAGTDDLIDMVKNINLLSWKGIKLSAYRSARRIMKDVTLYPHIPIIVTGHSLGGAVVIALKKMFNIDYCIAFAPARCLRYWSVRKMKDTTLFIDPDDPVSKVGCISFGLPKCNIIKAKNDHLFISIDDHSIENWEEFINKMEV